MRKNTHRTHNSHNQLRQLLAKEAARLMYEDGVTQYFDAKRKAAKRFSGQLFRAKDLPSNGEISLELAKLVELFEDDTEQRLLAMRYTALSFMHALELFHPRLIGSVSTGRIRKGSDIDLHVFTDTIEVLEQHLNELDWSFEKQQVLIRRGAEFVEYTHIYIEADFPVELSVYPLQELRVTGRSSTDLKPIKRLKIADVEALLAS